MPELTPTVLPSSAAEVAENQQKTGASGSLNMSFTTPIHIIEGSAIVLTLPRGFSPCLPEMLDSDRNVSGVVFAELLSPTYCWLRAVSPGAALQECGDVHVHPTPCTPDPKP